MITHLIDRQGSLILLRDHRGTLLVQLRDAPHHVDTLSTAYSTKHVNGITLNGSQAVTVTNWFKENI